jgi:glycosyltransferase involved in cell wall biosynthesis
MKILQISQYNPFYEDKQKGGVEQVIFEISNRLIKLNYNVEVVFIADKPIEEVHNKIKLIGLDIPKLPTKLGLMQREIDYRKKISIFLKKHGNEYDIIHAHGWSGVPELANFNTIGTLHGLTSTLKNQRNFLVNKILRASSIGEENLIKYSTFLTCVSKRICNDVQKDYNRKKNIQVIYNGVDTHKLKPITYQEKIHLRQRLHMDNNYTYIIFVGLNPKMKRFDIAQKAVAINGGNKKLITIGLKEGLGRLPHDKVIEYMKASNMLILPSDYDPFPIVCMEALSLGIPIIISDKVGVSEIIESGKQGFIINKQNPVLYSTAIRNVSKTKSMAIEARKLAIKYDWNNIVKQYLNIYKKFKY